MKKHNKTLTVFNGNWKYLFIETSKENIQSYYQHFDNTLRFFPKSDTTIIPDAYHIILGLLLLINIVLVIRKIIIKSFGLGKPLVTSKK